jgi:hypothetical protein
MRQAELPSREGAAAPIPDLRRAAAIIERRWEPRYTTNDPAAVKVLPAGTTHAPGLVLDISRFGLRVQLPMALEKGMEVKVTMPLGVVVVGQVRYCRPVDSAFQVGISTKEVIYAPEEQEQHIHDDALALFAGGRGLTAPEVIKLKDHLMHCVACRIRLADAPIPQHRA